jgi:hypothetical protein
MEKGYREGCRNLGRVECQVAGPAAERDGHIEDLDITEEFHVDPAREGAVFRRRW